MGRLDEALSGYDRTIEHAHDDADAVAGRAQHVAAHALPATVIWIVRAPSATSGDVPAEAPCARFHKQPDLGSARRGLPLASGKAVGAFNVHADNQAVITNHGGPIVGPVRVLTLYGTVKVDEFLDRSVVRVAGHWR